jgi:ElaB/YqjD/DUF883 family membrane-anchored ribosome-binding protein
MAKKVDKIKAKAKQYETKAKMELKKAKEKFMKHERKVRELIQKNPEKAVSIAAGLGATLGAAAVGAYALKKKLKK